MDAPLAIAGLVLSIIGLAITVDRLKIILAGKRDELGFDYKTLAVGFGLFVGGIIMIIRAFTNG